MKISSERCGIAIVGNMGADRVKNIDFYPQKQMHTTITSVSNAVGGCVPNTGINLSLIDPLMKIQAIGKVGKDDDGAYIIRELQRHHIDTDRVVISESSSTAFSDVMNLITTGERTVFHYRGADAEFSPMDVDLPSLHCKMLHIGYILLLDNFDKSNERYGTEMAMFLAKAQELGVKTSIDVVSESGGNYREKVLPALRYTDNAIMNEIECCSVAEVDVRDISGKLIPKNLRYAMEFALKAGVKERVIVHCPEVGISLTKDGKYTVVPSLRLPEGFIQGSVGAGDAFCAGCLYGIYHHYSEREILEFASGAAACNLSAVDSVSGMRSKEEILRLIRFLPRQSLPEELLMNGSTISTFPKAEEII